MTTNAPYTYQALLKDDTIRAYVERADLALCALGYTEHGLAHAMRVARTAGDILASLGMDAHLQELARIAGYMHDIGNVVNRIDHSQSGAVMAFRLLEERGMPPCDVCTVISAIGNHDEGTGTPVNEVSAALILADKSDVLRSRVRAFDPASPDIHDRVNYSVTQYNLTVHKELRQIELALSVDTDVSPVLEFFEIFTERMTLCRQAAQRLGTSFRLRINDHILL